MASAAQVKRALDRFAAELSGKKNVLGLGRVPSRSGEPGEWDLAVYVSAKVAREELAEEDLVPRRLELPGRSRTVPITTQVIAQGEVELEPGAPEPGMPGLDRL